MMWSLAASAQTPATAPATQPAEPPGLTVESLRNSIEALRAAPLADTDLQKSVLESFGRALLLLEEAQKWRDRAAAFRNVAASGPQELEQLRARLARPSESTQPVVAADEDADRLSRRLSELQAELKLARDRLRQNEEDLRARPERRKQLTDELAKAKSRLAELANSSLLVNASETPPELRASQDALQRAQQAALRAQIDALEQESLTFDLLGDLLTARRDVAAREVARLETSIRVLEQALLDRRRQEAEQQAAEADRIRREAARAHPLVREVAEENARLARLRADVALADRIAALGRRLEDRTAELAALKSSFDRVRKQVDAVGLSPALGERLRALRSQLYDVRPLVRASDELQAKIADSSAQVLTLSDQLGDYALLDSVVEELMSRFDAAEDEADAAEIRRALLELLNQRRQILSAFKGEYETYAARLIELDGVLRQIISRTREFRDYIDQRILWVRSASALRIRTVLDSLAAASGRFLDAGLWTQAAADFRRGANARGTSAVGLSGLILVLLLARPWAVRRQANAAAIASKSTTLSFAPTAEATVLTIIRAAPWPLSFWALQTVGNASAEWSILCAAFGGAMSSLAMFISLCAVVWHVCAPNGLALHHFGWPAQAVARLRRTARWAASLGAPPLLLWTMLDQMPEDWGLVPLAQISFALFQIVLLGVSIRIWSGSNSLIRWFAPQRRGARFAWFSLVLRPLCVAVPVVLSLMSLFGYHYTATHLFHGAALTATIGLSIEWAYLMALRWLLLSRRKLAIQQARQRREAAQQADDARLGEAEATPAESQTDLTTISAQARGLAASLAIFVFAVVLLYTWDETLSGLAFLKQVTLWTTTQQVTETVVGPDGAPMTRTIEQLTRIDLADLTFALIVVVVSVVLSRNVPGLLEIVLLQRLPLGAGERYAISAVSRYVIAIVGTIMAFSVIGVGWSKVQWLVAAATVGLGFGLQEIFANFVSGLIILFERPVRVGDIVTVGGVEGVVTRIQIRATTIQDWDRRELLVPNREFITNQLINWTLSDPVTRLIVPVGIAYGSDTTRARELLLDIAKRCPHVLNEPEPTVVFRSFGDSALLFELRVFIPTRDCWPAVVSALHFMIDNAFRDAGIEIAFPQRDIHIRSIHSTLPIQPHGMPTSAGEKSGAETAAAPRQDG